MWALPALGFNLCPEPAEPNLAPGDREDVGYRETENKVGGSRHRGTGGNMTQGSLPARTHAIPEFRIFLVGFQKSKSKTVTHEAKCICIHKSGGEYLHKRGGITCAEPCCNQARFEGQRSWPYIYKTRFDHRGLLLPLPIRGLR